MLPGKKYGAEDLIEILRRRKWLIVLPLALSTIGVSIYARTLPDQFRSEATVLIVPQRVPESYVRSTVTTRIEDRLELMREQILSRTKLDTIIREFALYPDLAPVMIREELVDRMRANVSFAVVTDRRRREGAGAFQVSFVYGDARKAMLVTERLASLFVNENIQDREVQALATSQFLESNLGEARQRLIEREKKLEAYRSSHAAELPSQQQSNLQAIQNTQMQLQTMDTALARDGDRRSTVERLLAEERKAEPALLMSSSPTDPSEPLTAASASARLDVARRQLAAMERRLMPEHPDMVQARKAIEELERQAKAESQSAAVGAPPDAPVSREHATWRTKVAGMDVEMQVLDRRIQANLAEQQRLQAQVSSYRQRVEAAPYRETELIELTRDYETYRQMYLDLLVKLQNSKMAVDLERRQAGEQFRLLDKANLPQKPISPDRRRLTLMGALLGFALGVGIVGFLEYRDTTFRTDADVVTTLALPVLASIPMVVSPTPPVRGRWWLIAGGCLVIAAGGAAFWLRWTPLQRLADTWIR